jgi:DNA-binding transcriptional MerR regulator
MSAVEDRHLSPAEVACRMGISTKALRLYEARGLVAPLRSQSGWRTYGAKEIARLHQILALKRLGLSLARIEELFSRRPVMLEALLSAQEDVLAREHARVDHALSLVRTARRTLAAGVTLSIDDLIQLTKETTMTTQEQRDEMKAVFDPLIEKHYSEEERAALRSRSYDQAQVAQAWDGLMAEARALMAKGEGGVERRNGRSERGAQTAAQPGDLRLRGQGLEGGAGGRYGGVTSPRVSWPANAGHPVWLALCP